MDRVHLDPASAGAGVEAGMEGGDLITVGRDDADVAAL